MYRRGACHDETRDSRDIGTQAQPSKFSTRRNIDPDPLSDAEEDPQSRLDEVADRSKLP